MAFTKTAGVEYGTPEVTLSTTAASGSNQTAIRTDGQLIAFSTDTPEPVGTSAAAGTDAVAARLDHVHVGTGAAGTTVDNTIARYNGTAGAIQGYTSGGPTISDTGTILASAQPTFGVVSRTAQNNCTGDGTTAKIEFDTELWDIGGNFSSNEFTAPVTGKYALRAQVQANAITSSATSIDCWIFTSNRAWLIYDTPGIITSQCTFSGAVVADLDAGDKAYVNLRVIGESGDIVDIQADASAPSTSFCGWLLG